MDRQKSIRFYQSYYDMAQHMSDDQRHKFYDAVLYYAFDGSIPDFGGDVLLEVAWLNVRPNIDSSIKRSLDGQRGGRPKKTDAQSDSPVKAKVGAVDVPVRFVAVQ